MDDVPSTVRSERAALRARLGQARLALSLLVAGVATMHAGAWLGVVDRQGLWLWTAVSVSGLSIATISIQLGATRHLDDPSLTLPQMLFATTCTAWAYTLAGSAHAIVTLMQALALSFGIFGASARPAIYCAAYSVVIFAAAMIRQCLVDPARYHAVDDFLLFVFLVLIVVGIVINTMRVNRLRSKIVSQRGELQLAFERIQELAQRDELTGLSNRRRVMQLLEEEAARARRSGAPWCVAMIDLDFFKRINDTHGHAAGDAVLRWFAGVARSVLRSTDTLGRWGGEEFVLLMPDTGLDAGMACLERLRQALASEAPATGGLRVTFSAGIAQHLPGQEWTQAVDAADERAYLAKSNGRDRIEGAAADTVS